MAELSEAYPRGAAAGVGRRRVAGAGSAVAGVALVVGGLVAGVGSAVAGWPDPWVAVALAGTGPPAALLGALAVLPADDRTLAAGAIGAGLAGLGVALFVGAPSWRGADPLAAVVYALGVGTALACVAAVVTPWDADEAAGDGETTADGPATRSDDRSPGSGESSDRAWTGSWEAAAVRADRPTGAAVRGGGAASDAASGATSDGGATAAAGGAAGARPSDGAVVLTSAGEESVPSDAYCGNCARFRYVRTDGTMQPYCAHHDALMDDMTACEDWRANR